MRFRLLGHFLILVFLSACSNGITDLSPLEKAVKNKQLDESEVTYLYMYKGDDDYRAIIEKNLKLCAVGKFNYLAISTFDRDTEKVLLSIFNKDYAECQLIFFGTSEAVTEAREFFPKGTFIAGDLSANSEIRKVYKAATENIN